MTIITHSKPSNHILIVNHVEHGPFKTEIELARYALSLGINFMDMDYEIMSETRKFHATTKWIVK